MFDSAIKTLDDKALLLAMTTVAATIREQQVRGLQLLSEVDERKLYLREGYESLWAHCTLALKLSESGASRWTRAMRAVRRDPGLLEVDERLRAKIERAKEVLDAGSLLAIVEKALDLLLAKVDPLERSKRRSVRPAKAPTPPRKPSALPRRTRDATIARDGGRCTFVSNNGRRCECRRYLEVDHIQHRSCGGSDDSENLRTLCSAHHGLFTRETFGDFRRRSLAAASC